ncbi:pyridoxamine 5'-phosphate oxidase family protein [Antrihabitans stalactiti]|uniref:PPOX class F420-dependent oxidoreductase n=1 Tax=Antrihabitans stalactiti TaxID=2584121 RepID=A0A848KB11_9NOCA|nr:PPOX class F420-dependent oxidoreductase [Antrihabitans stalactiti]NMN94394.1 PPOX class F420-dependent oxidoreductase [Antrihabitans stalactiti]
MGVNQRAQIVMSDDEVREFLEQSRVVTIATNGPSGTPHLVAMWYALIDGEIWFETKAKSQKVVNLRRDDRITCHVEAGYSYDQLRGVSIEGHAEVIEDQDLIFEVGKGVWERYTGPYTEEMRPAVEAMISKRVAVRVRPHRVRSWDHRKLGYPDMPVSGTTAQYIEQPKLS